MMSLIHWYIRDSVRRVAKNFSHKWELREHASVVLRVVTAAVLQEEDASLAPAAADAGFSFAAAGGAPVDGFRF